MPGLTSISPADLPADLPYWLSAYGLQSFFGTTPGTAVTVNYSLHTTGTNPFGEAYRSLSAGEISNIETSLARIAFETGLTFSETNDAGADIFIGATSDPSSTTYGRTWQFTTQPVQVTAYDAVYSTPDGLANNGYIYIHELLHAVGLDHSTRAFGSTLPDVIPDDEDNGTTLYGSWFSGWDGGTQLFDVAVLQFLYGPDTSARAGDDVYVPIFAAYDVSNPNDNQPLLWDGAGFDTIDLSSALGGATASLAVGVISQVNTTNTGILEAGTFSINYNSVFEKLIGTDFDDTLSGSSGDETLIGGKGKDTLKGKNGADTLTGGGGGDKFIFKAAQNSGANTITDFQDGLDRIKLIGGVGIDDLTIVASGTDTVISWANGQVTLLDTAETQISADDFIFV